MNTEIMGIESTPVEVESTSQKAFEIMGNMLGDENVSAVKGLGEEFSTFIGQITPEQWEGVGVASLVGAGVGFAFGILLTHLTDKKMTQMTGQKPVPALGNACSVIPTATLIGGIVGMGVKLIAITNGTTI